MGGADVGEIPFGGFNVVVIAGDACLVEAVQLFFIQEAHGGAQLNIAFLAHGVVCLNGGIKFLP